MILWRKQEGVEKMLGRYFDNCDRCFACATRALDIYFERGLGEKFEAAVNETHTAESEADDLRRQIELTLYGRALLPESRGDLLGLLETYDKLPNMAETVVFALLNQRVVLPEDLKPMYRKLAEVNLESYRLARNCVEALMTNPKITLHVTREVDLKESESDRIERELLRQIFQMDASTGDKLLLKDIVLLIGTISDRAESVADRIGIVAIKRQV